ncbi:MAG: bifunctional riboflavin kinase/FAD synthetase [Firmicutes bacterium]|nr:bifunctional riboflavin kinase/FAD synthetase [Bacillota bacterium]
MIEFTTTTQQTRPIALGLGFFDGVHLGHRTLVDAVLTKAKQKNYMAGFTTFTNNPNPQSKLLYTYEERKTIFSSLQLDFVLPFNLDSALKNTSPKDFLDFLTTAYPIKTFIAGHDYSFGKGGLGVVKTLEEYAAKKGIEVIVLPPVSQDGIRVSSTRIKSLIESGNLKKAEELLAMPFFVFGKVVRGAGRGKKIGFPTANIEVEKDKILPPSGVYLSTAIIQNQSFQSLTHIGAKPTFLDSVPSLETHIIDYNGDLYDQLITVQFNKKIREIIKFESSEKLTQQIKKDLLFCKNPAII